MPTRRTTTSGSSSSSRSPRQGDRRGRGRRGGPAARSWPPRSRRTRPSRARRRCSAPSQLAGVDWDQVALVLWQAPLPDERRGRARSRRSSGAAASAIFFPPRAPGNGEAPRRPLDGLAGAEGRGARSRAGGATRTCWPTRQSGAPLPVGQLQVRRSCGLSGGELTPLATLKGRRPAAGPGRRPTAAARTSARPRRRAATPRWRPTASSSTSWCSGRWPPGPRVLGSTRQLAAGEPTRRRPRPLGARRRRRGGDLDRIRRPPRRLCLRRPAAGREPLGRRGVGRRAGRPPR